MRKGRERRKHKNKRKRGDQQQGDIVIRESPSRVSVDNEYRDYHPSKQSDGRQAHAKCGRPRESGNRATPSKRDSDAVSERRDAN